MCHLFDDKHRDYVYTCTCEEGEKKQGGVETMLGQLLHPVLYMVCACKAAASDNNSRQSSTILHCVVKKLLMTECSCKPQCTVYVHARSIKACERVGAALLVGS